MSTFFFYSIVPLRVETLALGPREASARITETTTATQVSRRLRRRLCALSYSCKKKWNYTGTLPSPRHDKVVPGSHRDTSRDHPATNERKRAEQTMSILIRRLMSLTRNDCQASFRLVHAEETTAMERKKNGQHGRKSTQHSERTFPRKDQTTGKENHSPSHPRYL